MSTMYEDFMGLSQRPFVASPDVNMYVRTEVHEKALRQLMFGMNANRGISLLTGAAGTGKSILAQKLIRNLESTTIPLFFPNAHFSTRRDFYQSILFELRQPFSGMGLQELRLQLTSVMRQMAPRHRPILLVIDEAHLLRDRILEEVRNCLNFVVEGDCIFRTLLVGHPELEERLADPDLAAVNSRVGAHALIHNLNRAQSVQYISQRLKLAHGVPESIFETEAIFAIAEAADGSPRAINQLCDHALMLATARGVRPVDLETVLDSLEELQTLPLHWRTPSALTARESSDVAPVVRTDKPAFENFQADADNQQGASIEVGSAWQDETGIENNDQSSIEFVADDAITAVEEIDESELLGEILEDLHDPDFEPRQIEENIEDIDPVLDARLAKLTDEEIKQDAVAEVCLLNDVLNVQLKDEQEETAAERRFVAKPVEKSVNQPANRIQPSSEVVMDRYALIDAGLVDQVREWETTADQRSSASAEATTTPGTDAVSADNDVYPLLQEDVTPQSETRLGSISLSQQQSDVTEATPDALDQLKASLPEGHLEVKFNRSSKSA